MATRDPVGTRAGGLAGGQQRRRRLHSANVPGLAVDVFLNDGLPLPQARCDCFSSRPEACSRTSRAAAP